MRSRETAETARTAGDKNIAGGNRRFSIGKLKTISSLANPVFRLYYAASLGQQAAQSMQLVTTPMLAYRVTGSAAILGVVALGGAVPHIFGSLYGGAIADRVQKKYVMLVSQVGLALTALALAIFLFMGWLNKNTW